MAQIDCAVSAEIKCSCVQLDNLIGRDDVTLSESSEDRSLRKETWSIS